MANQFTDMLAQAAQTTIPDQVTQNPTAATASPVELAVSIGEDNGFASANQMELDMRTMNPAAFVGKYGDQGARFLDSVNIERDKLNQYEDSSRSLWQIAGDTTNAVVGGGVQGVGGLASMLTGIVSDSGGAAIASAMDDVREFSDSLLSDTALEARRFADARQSQSERDSLFQYDQDVKAGKSEFMAGIERIGRDALSAVTNYGSDPTQLFQGGAEIGGSLLAGGIIARGVKLAAAGVRGIGMLGESANARKLIQAIENGTGTGGAAFEKAADKVAWLVANGSLELGSTYAETNKAVNQAPLGELMANPEFVASLDQNIASGMTPVEAEKAAREQLANETGLFAAAAHAPMAFAASFLTKGLEKPLSNGFANSLLNAAAKEPLEEALQGASSQLAQNISIKENANPYQDVAEGVGTNIGQGALYGASGAGMIQSPALAGTAAKTASKAVAGTVVEAGRVTLNVGKKVAEPLREPLSKAAGAVKDSLAKRYAQVFERDAKAAPVSDEAINAAAEDVVQNAPTDITTMTEAVNATKATNDEKAAATDYVTRLGTAVQFDVDSLEGAAPEHIEAVSGATNRADAINKMARFAAQQADPEAQLDAAMTLDDMLEPLRGLDLADPDAISQLDPKSDAYQTVMRYKTLLTNVENSDAMRRFRTAMQSTTANSENTATLQPITDAELNTPVAERKVKAAVMMLRQNPESMSEESVETILRHADNGGIRISPAQVQVLRTAQGIIVAHREMLDKQKANGLNRMRDVVGSNIVSSSDPLADQFKLSGAQFAKSIFDQYQAGNLEAAAELLNELGKFTTHMNNKVQAINTSARNADQNGQGSKEAYQALNARNRTWFKSDENAKAAYPYMSVNLGKAGTLDFAQSLEAEAQAVGTIHNVLSEAFPELKQAMITLAQLDDSLRGNPVDMANEFNTGKRKAKENVAVLDEVANRPDPEPVAEPEATPTEQLQEAAKETPTEQIAEAAKETPDVLEANGIAPSAPLSELRTDRPNSKNPFTDSVIQRVVYHVSSDMNFSLDNIEIIRDADPNSHWVRQGGGFATNRVGFYTTENLGYALAVAGAEVPTGVTINTLNDAKAAGIDLSNINVVLMYQNTINPYIVAGDNKFSTTAINEAELAALQKAGYDSVISVLADGSIDESIVFDADDVAPITQPKKQKVDPVKQMEAAFPLLTNGIINMFHQAFKLPKTVRSRLTGVEGTLTVVTDSLRNEATLVDAIGDVRGNYTREIAADYQAILTGSNGGLSVADIRNILQNNLQAFLNETYSKKTGTTIRDELSSGRGRKINRWNRGKVVNLLNENLEYDAELLDQAILAAVQWFIGDGQWRSSFVEAEDIAAIFSDSENRVDPTTIDDALVDLYNTTFSNEDVTQGIGRKIAQYWGLSANRDVSISYTNGIPEAMANEIIRAMIDLELIKQTTARHPNSKKTNNRFETVKFDPDTTALAAMPDVLDQLVLTEPELVHYIGDDLPPVAQNQMNNPIIQNTREQKLAIKNTQKDGYTLHMPMYNLYNALGEDGLIALFGGGMRTEGVDLNEQHKATIDGKNTTVIGAYKALKSTVAALENRGDINAPVHYAMNFSSVNRMHMLGAHNPQASKLNREALMTTWADLDMTNQEHNDAFYLGVAQAVGLKVHNLGVEESIRRVKSMLNDGLRPALNRLKAWHLDGQTGNINYSSLAQELKAGGSDVTPVALMALLETVRAQGQTTIRTPMYLEADGITNGPINAMMLYNYGSAYVTGDWVENVARGGVSFGTAPLSADQIPGHDLYQETANKTLLNMGNFVSYINQQKNAAELNYNLNSLMGLMLETVPGIALNEEGNYVLDRKVPKNPLTVTIYGSSANGIADKVTKTMVDSIYEMLSTAIAAQKRKESVPVALFPDSADPSGDYRRFVENIARLTTSRAYSKDGVLLVTKGTAIDDQVLRSVHDQIMQPSFKFSAENLDHIRSNVHQLFVNQLDGAIRDTVGLGTMDTVSNIQITTSVQSTIHAELMRQAIEDKIAERLRTDPTYHRGDFLSEAELQKIEQDLLPLAPVVQQDGQVWQVSKQQRAFSGSFQSNESLAGTLGTNVNYNLPADAGVAGIPYMVIGGGDAKMIQNLALNKDIQNALYVFDGVNLSLDKINTLSPVVNQSVYDAWQNDMLSAIAAPFEAFLANQDKWEHLLEDTDLRAKVGKTLGFTDLVSTSALIRVMEIELNSLKQRAEWAKTRQEIFTEIPMSVDHMAAAGKPFSNGVATTDSLTSDQVAELINSKYAQKTKTVASDAGVGFTVYSMTRIKRMLKEGNLNEEHKVIVDQIVRSGLLKQVTVISGTPAEINAHRKATGLSEITFEEGTKGLFDPNNGTVYITKMNNETLVHELIHSVIYSAIADYYNGVEQPAHVAKAVERLRALQDQFMQSTYDFGDDIELLQAVNDLKAEIDGYIYDNSPQGRINALNEYVAWTLANPALQQDAKKTFVTKFKLMTENAIKALKSLVWGRKRAPKVAEDVLSNVQFNASILIRSTDTIYSKAHSNALYHRERLAPNTRMRKIRDAFNDVIVRHVPDTFGAVPDPVTSKRIADAVDVANAAQTFFNLNNEQRSVIQSIVAGFSTEEVIDPVAVGRIHALYAKAVDSLSIDDFMVDTGNPNQDYQDAAERYDLITGKRFVRTDNQGRRSTVPLFIAMSIVDQNFADKLKRIDVPKSERENGDTLDQVLANAGTTMMDKLGEYMSGDQGEAKIGYAMEALAEHIAEQVMQESAAIERGDNILDKANQYIVDQMENLSDNGLDLGRRMTQSASPSERAAGRVVELVSGLLTEKNGEVVARGVISLLSNDGKSSTGALYDFVNGLVGRTKDNFKVYDMIKSVRAAVQQVRQQYRNATPKAIKAEFTRELTRTEWEHVFDAVAKTDLVSLSNVDNADLLRLFSDQNELDAQINDLEQLIQQEDSANWNLYRAKMIQLAQFMNTGTTRSNLLRNANAISRLFGENKRGRYRPTTQFVESIDRLVTLYAIDALPQAKRDTLANLAQTEGKGLSYTMDYLRGQRTDEQTKVAADESFIYNHYKGYVPQLQEEGASLRVVDKADHLSMVELGYVLLGDYQGSNIEGRVNYGYYYSPTGAKAAVSQGIMQNVRHTASGLDSDSGLSTSLTAGVIRNNREVQQLARRMGNERSAVENLMPIYNSLGKVVAFERSMNPVMSAKLNYNKQLADVLGIWRGRQVEEELSAITNRALVDNMKDMYDQARGRGNEFIDLFDTDKLDPVERDMVDLFTPSVLAYARTVFGDSFWVHKSMLNDVIGYRNATVTDAWTGNTRFSEDTQRLIRHATASIIGRDTFNTLSKYEKGAQDAVGMVRNTIVVKSVVVPAFNVMSNIAQLASRGISPRAIARGLPAKLSEIETYSRTRLEQIELEADLRSQTHDARQSRRTQARIDAITDMHKRMSIWPLIEAGEFSAVADVGMTDQDLELTSGNLQGYIEKQIERLPKGLQTAARYGLVARDTALYRGLQKSVQYGDFVAKAVLYDNLVNRKGMTKEEALGRITEEFVNYDRLPSRSRAYLENMGLLWFFNFKMRISKVALSTLRNNPLYAVMTGLMPLPSGAGLPVEDNMFTKLFEGTLGYSIGPEMLGQGIGLNPWYNLVN